MKKDRWLLRAVVLLALSAALMSGVSLAAEAGSPQDPLVTLSYLNDTFFSSVMQQVDQKIAQRTGQSVSGVSAASFAVGVHRGGNWMSSASGTAPHTDMHSTGRIRSRTDLSLLSRSVST